MMRVPSRRIAAFATLLLAVAIGAFSASDIAETREARLPRVPMPAPNADVGMNGYASVTGSYQLFVEVPSPPRPFALALNNNGPTLPYTLSISAPGNGEPVPLKKAGLRLAGDYAAGSIKIYSSPTFQMKAGDFSLIIHNDGGTSPTAFLGGMAYLVYPEPVRIPFSIVARVVGYSSGLLALLLLARAAIAGRD